MTSSQACLAVQGQAGRYVQGSRSIAVPWHLRRRGS